MIVFILFIFVVVVVPCLPAVLLEYSNRVIIDTEYVKGFQSIVSLLAMFTLKINFKIVLYGTVVIKMTGWLTHHLFYRYVRVSGTEWMRLYLCCFGAILTSSHPYLTLLSLKPEWQIGKVSCATRIGSMSQCPNNGIKSLGRVAAEHVQ